MIGPGTHLDPHTRLTTLIERGGEGEVWKGEDLRLDRAVAVKVLPASDPWGHPDATAQEVRAWREARAVARLLHPAIAAVYHVGMWHDRPFLVMEWVEGESLRARLARGPIPLRQAGAWLRAIGHAVQHAHDRGVIHCDLKPENILVRAPTPGSSPIKLVDFGLARGDGLAHRSPVQVRGTVGYLPPEAGQQRPAATGDQFALAVIATELLCGERPVLNRDGSAQLPPLPRLIADNARGVLRRGLASRAADRYPDVASFIDALSASLPAHERGSSAARGDEGHSPIAASAAATDALTGDELGELPAAVADQVVLALQGVVPSNEQLERCLGGPGLRAARRRLVAAGVLHAQDHNLRPVAPSLAADASARLPPRLRRRAHTAVAVGLERGDLSLPWVAEEATTAWLRAERPLDAARCLEELASVVVKPLERCALLERAARLRASAPNPEVHATAQLRWGITAAACGRRHDAERALAAALGSLQLARQPLSGRGWSLRAAVRELRGDALAAASAWEQAIAVEQPLADYARACVGRTRALLRTGQPAINQALEAQQAAEASDRPELRIAAALTAGVALERVGEHGRGLKILRAATFDALCLGVPLTAAVALVTLGEALRRIGRPEAARLHLEEARDALLDQGVVGPAASLALLEGRIALAAGQVWSAWGKAQRAVTLAELLGLRPHELAGLRLALESAKAAGQPAETRAVALRIADIQRRGAPRSLEEPPWGLDGTV